MYAHDVCTYIRYLEVGGGKGLILAGLEFLLLLWRCHQGRLM